MSQLSTSHVFVSYSRRDDEVMRRVVLYLREQGIKVWVDNERLVPGTPVWEEEIEKAIKSASAIVVVLSPEAKNSEWVRREITLADQFRKRVFPVLLRGDEEESIPLRLITHQFVDMRMDVPAGLRSLFNALSFYLKNLETLGPKEHELEEVRSKTENQAVMPAGKPAVRKRMEKSALPRKVKSANSSLLPIGFVGILILVLCVAGYMAFRFLPGMLSSYAGLGTPTSLPLLSPSAVPIVSPLPTSTAPRAPTNTQEIPTNTAVPATNTPLPPSKTRTPTSTLDPIYSRDDRISGIVTFRGEPVEGIPVGVIIGPECDTTDVIQKTVTDAQGRYFFLNIDPGKYRVAINGWNGIDTRVEPYGQTCSGEYEKEGGRALPVDWNLHKTDLHIVFPVENSSITTTSPTFQWNAYPAAARYEVILIQTSPIRKTIIWLAPTTNTNFTPETALTPGNQYWLLVWAWDNSYQIAVGTVYFEIQ